MPIPEDTHPSLEVPSRRPARCVDRCALSALPRIDSTIAIIDPSGAVADWDGSGKVSVTNTAMHNATHRSSDHARAYYLAKAKLYYYAAMKTRLEELGITWGSPRLAEYSSAIRRIADASGEARLALGAWRDEIWAASPSLDPNSLGWSQPSRPEVAGNLVSCGLDFAGASGATKLDWKPGALTDGLFGAPTVFAGRGDRTRGDRLTALISPVPGVSTFTFGYHGTAMLGIAIFEHPEWWYVVPSVRPAPPVMPEDPI